MLWRIYSFWTIRIRGPRTKVSGTCVTYADQAVLGSLIRILFMIRHQCVQSLWIHPKEIYFLILKVRCKCFSLVDSMAKALTNGKSIASNSQYECGTPWKRVSHSYLVLLICKHLGTTSIHPEGSFQCHHYHFRLIAVCVFLHCQPKSGIQGPFCFSKI